MVNNAPSFALDVNGSIIWVPIIIAIAAAGGLSSCSSFNENQDTTITLNAETENTPTTGECGNYSWVVKWIVTPKPKERNGVIAQSIKYSGEIRECKNGQDILLSDLNALPEYTEYWPLGHFGSHTDTFSRESQGQCTYGNIKIEASANYYPILDPRNLNIELYTPSISPHPTMTPNTTYIDTGGSFPSGSLPFSVNPNTALNNSPKSNTVKRSLEANWDCRGNDKTTTLNISE